MITARPRLFALAATSLFLASCGIAVDVTGPERTEPVTVDAPNAERANVELDMGAGQLTVAGGASQLLNGYFDYNVDSWKPTVVSATNGTHASVTIKQPGNATGGGRKKYTRDLQLNDRVLTDLTVNCGAGQAKLNLGALLLRSVEVHMGAGQVLLDLRGEPKHDYEVKINGGVGQAQIELPQGVGIWAEAHGGIGSVNITGLEKHGGHWENALYNGAKVRLKLQVTGGIGQIRIRG